MAKTSTGIVPGRYDREDIMAIRLAQMFPYESATVKTTEAIEWPDGSRPRLRCDGVDTYAVAHITMLTPLPQMQAVSFLQEWNVDAGWQNLKVAVGMGDL